MRKSSRRRASSATFLPQLLSYSAGKLHMPDTSSSHPLSFPAKQHGDVEPHRHVHSPSVHHCEHGHTVKCSLAMRPAPDRIVHVPPGGLSHGLLDPWSRLHFPLHIDCSNSDNMPNFRTLFLHLLLVNHLAPSRFPYCDTSHTLIVLWCIALIQTSESSEHPHTLLSSLGGGLLLLA